MATLHMRNAIAALDAAREAVTCSLCQNVIKDAVAVAHCRCQYCRDCIKEAIDDNGLCPVHKTPVFPKDLQPDHQLNGVLRHLVEIGALLDEQSQQYAAHCGDKALTGAIQIDAIGTKSQLSQASGPSHRNGAPETEHATVEQHDSEDQAFSGNGGNVPHSPHGQSGKDDDDDSSGSDFVPSFVQKHVAKKRGRASVVAGTSVENTSLSAAASASNRASDNDDDSGSAHNTTASHADAVPAATRTYGRRQSLRRGALRRGGREAPSPATLVRSSTTNASSTAHALPSAPPTSAGVGAAATQAWVLEQQRLHQRSVARQQRASDQERRRKQQQSRSIRAAASLTASSEGGAMCADVPAIGAPDHPVLRPADVLDDLGSPPPEPGCPAPDVPDGKISNRVGRTRSSGSQAAPTVRIGLSGARQRRAKRTAAAGAPAGGAAGRSTRATKAKTAASGPKALVPPGPSTAVDVARVVGETADPALQSNTHARASRRQQQQGSGRTPLAQRPAHTNNIATTPTITKQKSIRSTPSSSPGARSVHRRNHFGETPLHQAAKRGCVDTIAQLLALDADVNATDHNGWTPLHEACHHGFPAVAAALLAANADPNGCVGPPASVQLTTPLHEAAELAHMELVEILLTGGADASARDNDGKNAESLLPPHADDGIRKALATARERGRGAAVAPPPMSYPRGVGAPAIVVCTASVPKQLKDDVASALQVLGNRGVKTTTEFCDQVTHLVTAVDADRRCRRTQKYMLGVLHGSWIVSFDWLLDSANGDVMADERVYVVEGDTNSERPGGPLRSHDNAMNMGPQLFRGKFFCLHKSQLRDSQQMKAGDVAKLLTGGGGKIVKTERDLHTVAGCHEVASAFVVRSDVRDAPPRIRLDGIVEVGQQFILSCISNYEIALM